MWERNHILILERRISSSPCVLPALRTAHTRARRARSLPPLPPLPRAHAHLPVGVEDVRAILEHTIPQLDAVLYADVGGRKIGAVVESLALRNRRPAVHALAEVVPDVEARRNGDGEAWLVRVVAVFRAVAAEGLPKARVHAGAGAVAHLPKVVGPGGARGWEVGGGTRGHICARKHARLLLKPKVEGVPGFRRGLYGGGRHANAGCHGSAAVAAIPLALGIIASKIAAPIADIDNVAVVSEAGARLRGERTLYLRW